MRPLNTEVQWSKNILRKNIPRQDGDVEDYRSENRVLFYAFFRPTFLQYECGSPIQILLMLKKLSPLGFTPLTPPK
jgi:hypothetical protein